MKVLLEAISEQPSLFIEMVSAVFKANEDSGIEDHEPEDPERARAVAMEAYRLLELWNLIPGTREDGMIDGEALERWIKEARTLAKKAGREEVADGRIGMMLSASPMGEDGNWPAEPVRDVLDLFLQQKNDRGFWVSAGAIDGVLPCACRASGGSLERHEAETYRRWAKAINLEHPHTAKALDALADSYELEARRHDEDAARLDWEH